MMIKNENSEKLKSEIDVRQFQNWTFFIEGVYCSKCIQKLESLPDENSSLTDACYFQGTSTLDFNINSLKLKEQNFTPEDAIKLIENKGYKAYFITQKSELVEQRKREQRNWLMRLAITFFFAGNIMLFSASLYTGAADNWKFLFSALSGIFYLPIFFYSAIPFYHNSIQSIKDRHFSADLAVTIAFIWGSVFSYFNLLRGNDAFYFDSTSSFIFLILLARFILYKAQQSMETDLNPSLLFKKSPFYNILRNEEPLRVRFDQIKTNDFVLITQDQLVPVDGTLVNCSAEIDTSIFSGESIPQILQPHQDIKAGMILHSENAKILTEKVFEESELFNLFEGVLKNRQVKTKSQTQAEVFSQILLKIVSLLSVALFIYFGFYLNQWNEGFTRALALFTIACPCALALAIPLASVTTLKRAVSMGIIAKTPLIFEKLQEINTVIFDKTGTLTEGHLQFENYEPQNPSTDILQILLGLEEKSHHPLAKTLTQKLKTEGITSITIENRIETIGKGVCGNIGSDFYEIQRLQEETPQFPYSTGFSLFKNQNLILSVFFKDQIRPEALSILTWLKSKDINVQIFSGDRDSVVQHIAQKLNISNENAFAKMSPQEKSQKMQSTKALMVGDGHNDSLALSSAYTSMAVRGSAETSLQAADCYSQHLGLSGIPTLFHLSRFYKRLIHQNIGLSLTYNFVAGTLAIFGFINPLSAALLMPINSLLVITATAFAKPSLPQGKRTKINTDINNKGIPQWKPSIS